VNEMRNVYDRGEKKHENFGQTPDHLGDLSRG
jgi:hypothetical protein